MQKIIMGQWSCENLLKFLGITHVNNNSNWYKREIEIYDNNAMEFYEVGCMMFLSKGMGVGSEVASCHIMHVIQYYIPQHPR